MKFAQVGTAIFMLNGVKATWQRSISLRSPENERQQRKPFGAAWTVV